MITLDDFEQALHSLGLRYSRHGHRIRAQCPAHDDREPSLVVEWRSGTVRFKCFAGCPAERILSALGLKRDEGTLFKVRYFDYLSQIDEQKGIDLLTRVWNNLDDDRQTLARYVCKRRGLTYNRYRLADANWVRHQLESIATRSDLLESGLAYERNGEFQFRSVFSAGRVVIPYFRNGRVVSVRSRAVVGNEDGPKYLSLKGYPARVYIARLEYVTDVVIVEGEFKAMLLAERIPGEYSVFALPGVNSAWDELHQLCNAYCLMKRIVLFDSESSNGQVERAANRLASRIGGRAVWLPLHGRDRMAPDDFVIEFGTDRLMEHLRKEQNND